MKSKFSDLINSETPTLIDFSAEWCGPLQNPKTNTGGFENQNSRQSPYY